MRPIDADALKATYIVTSTTTNAICHLYVSLEDINSAPTIDLVRCGERKRGKWIKDADGCMVCSECGNPDEINGITGEFMGSNFCNECGADMRGAE